MAYGKSNYICSDKAFKEPKKSRDAWEAFSKLHTEWTWDALDQAKKTSTAKRRLEVLRFDSNLTAETCVGRTCKYFESGCTYTEDRRAVLESDIVVANHWLFGYHLKLLNSLDYALLGNFTNVVVDEAHKLEDGLRTAFTDSISGQKLHKLIGAFETAVLSDGREFPHKRDLISSWRTVFNDAAAAANANSDSAVTSAISSAQQLSDVLMAVRDTLRTYSYASDATGAAMSPEFASTFTEFFPNVGLPVLRPSNQTLSDEVRGKWNSYKIVYNEIDKLVDLVDSAISNRVDDNYVTYIDKNSRDSQISISPIELGKYLQPLYGSVHKMSVHYLSATLAVNGKMDVFARRVGVDVSDSRVVSGMFGSAFNLKNQATLYIAKDMPEPARDVRQETYRNKLADQIIALTTANEGNAFVLFTARDEMLAVASKLIPQSKHPVLVQDGASATDLLKEYRNTPDAILLGLKSFWEGVDVAGDKLSLVIIAKLPFPGRSDPIVNARRTKAGNAWFSYVDVPDMVFDLRQGVGRLIRTTTDTGMVAILDSRLLTKPYGKSVVKSTGFTQAHTDLNSALKVLAQYKANRTT
jgi:ATP-dependent DNA helicase DinG